MVAVFFFVFFDFIDDRGNGFVDLRRVRLGLGSVMWCLVIVSGSVVGWV